MDGRIIEDRPHHLPGRQFLAGADQIPPGQGAGPGRAQKEFLLLFQQQCLFQLKLPDGELEGHDVDLGSQLLHAGAGQFDLTLQVAQGQREVCPGDFQQDLTFAHRSARHGEDPDHGAVCRALEFMADGRHHSPRYLDGRLETAEDGDGRGGNGRGGSSGNRPPSTDCRQREHQRESHDCTGHTTQRLEFHGLRTSRSPGENLCCLEFRRRNPTSVRPALRSGRSEERAGTPYRAVTWPDSDRGRVRSAGSEGRRSSARWLPRVAGTC